MAKLKKESGCGWEWVSIGQLPLWAAVRCAERRACGSGSVSVYVKAIFISSQSSSRCCCAHILSYHKHIWNVKFKRFFFYFGKFEILVFHMHTLTHMHMFSAAHLRVAVEYSKIAYKNNKWQAVRASVCAK